MTLAEFVIAYRSQHNLSQRQFAERCGISNGTISNIEKGQNPATKKKIKTDPETLKKIATGMSISIHELLQRVDDMILTLDANPAALSSEKLHSLGFGSIPHTVKKPRLGRISCGEPIDSFQNYDGEDDVPEDIQCDFTLICEGDSMIGARIQDGDVVYIRQQPTVESGQIAAVLIDGEEKLLKRVLFKPNRIILQAENHAYEPLIFDGEEMNRVSIIGRAVGFTSIL